MPTIHYQMGKSVEVGLTGKDGFVGLPLLVGFSSGPTQAVVQIAGSGFRIGARGIAEAVRQSPVLANRLQRYVQTLAMQGTQVAACNRLHEVDERLARWLLMCQDRIGSNFVPLTQEFLAHMLGTRRASVTVAAGILQKAGLITYSRGHVNIVDRARLEGASCECYAIMQQQDKRWRNERPARLSLSTRILGSGQLVRLRGRDASQTASAARRCHILSASPARTGRFSLTIAGMQTSGQREPG